MKRLIRKASNMTLYHGTNLENLEKISQAGNKLIPNAGDGVGSWNPGHVYLATQYGVASAHGYGSCQKFFDEWDGGQPYVVLEFQANDEVLCNDPDNNGECKTWQASSDKNGQVAIKGEVQLPENAIVHFHGGEEWTLELSTELSNWKTFYDQHKNELLVPGEED